MKIIRQLTPVLSLLVLAACGGSEPRAAASVQPKSETVMNLGARDVVTIATGDVSQGVRVTGSLDPAERVELKAQVSGQLDRVDVEPGAVVRKGQVIAVIDSRTQQAQAAAARAQLSAAERDFAAAEMLFKAGAISERDHVNARSARDAARAQLAQIQESIRRAVVVAPQNGVVTGKLVSTGEAVQPGAALFVIADITRLELKGSIPAEQVASVHVGDDVNLVLEAYPGRTVRGRVDRIDPVADAATRQVAVYVVVPNGNRELVGGLFATGTIVTDAIPAQAAPVIPQAAIVDGKVFRVVDGKARRVPVAEVRGGDVVIATPSADLKDGAVVKIAEVSR